MSFQPADPGSLAAFVALCLVMLGLCYFALRRTAHFKAWFGGLVAIAALMSISAASGFTDDHPVPVLPVGASAVILFGVLFSFSRSGRDVADRTSLTVLIGFQSFRLPLELILHQWAKLGTVPETMTWTGSNWDIVSGVVSLAVIPWCARHRAVVWFAQLVGFVLLANVLRVVILSSPLPVSWELENPLRLAMHFPYVLIVPLCVLPALVGHLVTFRALLRPVGEAVPETRD